MRLRRRIARRPPAATETAAPPPTGSLSRRPEAFARTLFYAFVDLVAIVREMLARPWRLCLGAAEVAGEIVLSAWETVVLPPLELGLRALRAVLRFGERQVTPGRGLAVVALAATITLGASQFSDYRAVEIGAPAYSGVETVAPAPELGRKSPRSAHGIAVFAIAVAALLVTALAVGGNWRLARLLTVLGVAVILISLLVDAHKGLREGLAATTYEGAKATLLAAFWVQLWSGVTLAVSGPLLAVYLRGDRAARRTTNSARRLRRSDATANTLPTSAGSSGAEGTAR
jgi:hypothetical protein